MPCIVYGGPIVENPPKAPTVHGFHGWNRTPIPISLPPFRIRINGAILLDYGGVWGVMLWDSFFIGVYVFLNILDVFGVDLMGFGSVVRWVF